MAVYKIYDLQGRCWDGDHWSYWFEKHFYSKGSVIACMRMLKKAGYRCYYEKC